MFRKRVGIMHLTYLTAGPHKAEASSVEPEAGAPHTSASVFDVTDFASVFPREAIESGARKLSLSSDDPWVETGSYMASLRVFFAVLRGMGIRSIQF